MSMENLIDDEIKEAIFQESSELLSGFDKDMELLKNSPGNEDLKKKIHRVIHTIKGGVGMLGFDELCAFLQKFEDAALDLRENKMRASEEMFNLFKKAKSLVETSLNEIKQNGKLNVTFENLANEFKTLKK